MIFRLDKPTSQATFTNGSDGIPPTSSKWCTPVDEIRYTDTVYTAPASGLTGYWFTNTSVGRTVPVSTAYIANHPIMKFWWGNGLPSLFSNPSLVTNGWSAKFKGYFQFPYLTTNYTFYFGGEGVISKFLIDGTNYLSADASITSYSLNLTDTAYATSKAFLNNFVENVWKTVEIHYEQRNPYNKTNSGLCVLWNTTNSTATPTKIVLSAGVSHTFGAGAPVNGDPAIYDTAIPDYIDSNLQISDGQGGTFTFDVPLLSTSITVSTASMHGYYYDPGSDLYRHIANGRTLKKFRKIVYRQGYKNPSGVNEFVQKFTGQIRDFNVKLDPSGQDKLQVICHSYDILTKEQINIDAPNPIDYISVGYMDEVFGHVDGLDKPPTFDGWEVHKAFVVMCTNSFLDPYYMTLRERKSNRAGSLIYSNYNVAPYGYQYKVYLDRDPIKYGNPLGFEPDSKIEGSTLPPDAKYLHEVGFGEYYQDQINKITSIYGMSWGVDRYGYPFLKTLDVPRSYLNDRDVGTNELTYGGVWTTTGTDINAFKATFSSASVVWSSVTATFTGSKCVALVSYHPNGGNHSGLSTAGQLATIFTQIRKSGVAIETNWFNTYLSTAWYSYDGIYTPLGVNPSILYIGNNLTYDTYTVHLWRHNNTGREVRFEGFLFYDDDLDGTKFRFRSGDANGPGQITNLDVENTAQDIRNEAYVLGKFLSYKYQITPNQSNQSEDQVKTSLVNPDNPTGQYIQSITRDLDSIYKSTAANYVGMPKRTLIFDPSIGSQSQADYLSLNFIRKYQTPGKNLSFNSLGNPLIEVNDKITINDDYTQSIDSSLPAWVSEVHSDFNKTYISDYEGTSFRPIGSFFPKPQPDVDDSFNGTPFLNFRVENRGVITRLNATLSNSNVTSISLSTVNGLPQKGYIYLQRYKDGNKLYEIIKYNRRDPDGTNPGNIYSLTRGLQYSSTESWNSGQYVVGAYDPYMQEGTGIVPIVKFDSLVTGKIYIEVLGDINGVPHHISTLTGIGQENWPFDTYDTIEWGESITYAWDGRDSLGNWNDYFVKIDGQSDMVGAKGYYVAEPKDINQVPQFSQFYFNIRVIDENENEWNYSTKDKITDRIVSTASVFTRRGPVGKVSFKIQPNGCWYPKYAPISSIGTNLVDGRYDGIPREAGVSFTTWATSWAAPREFKISETSSTWPYHCFGVDEVTENAKVRRAVPYNGLAAKKWPYQTSGNQYFNQPYRYFNAYADSHRVPGAPGQRGVLPLLYFTSTSNGGNGLKTLVRSGVNPYNERGGNWPVDKRIQEVLDSDYRRHYSIDLKWQRNVLVYVGWGPWVRVLGNWPNVVLWASGDQKADIFFETNKGDFFVDSEIRYNFYNGGNGLVLYFNPKNITGELKYYFQPVSSEVLSYYNDRATLNNSGRDDGTEHRSMYFYNFATFTGEFVDNAGRKALKYGDLTNNDYLYNQGFKYFTKNPSDNSTLIRYDENDLPRAVGYYDDSIPRKYKSTTSFYVPGMVCPSAPWHFFDDDQFHFNASLRTLHIQDILTNMWFYKQE